MPLCSTITVADHDLRVSLPETTREVLEYRSLIAPRLEKAWREKKSSGILVAVEWAISWLERYLDKDAAWIDEWLTPWELHCCCLQVIELSAILWEVAEEVETWAKMIGEGGCQCAICENPEKSKDWDERTLEMNQKNCRWVEVSLEAQSLIGCVHSLQGSDMLQAPWYLYQARERYEIGLAMGRRSAQKKDEKRERFLKEMEKAGVRTRRRR